MASVPPPSSPRESHAASSTASTSLPTSYDGPANDTVAYALDGVPLANPARRHDVRHLRGLPRRACAPGPYALSNRLYFRSGAPPSAFGAFVDTAAQGFYFDDLFYAVADQSAPAFRLAAYATGFEPGFSAGSIQGQESWSGGTIPIAASVDQTVDLSGLNQRTGTGAWRISNNTSLGGYNGTFAGWPFSPGLPVSAGQPSSRAGADQFTATLWFRSASASADGSYIEIDLGNVVGDNRTTFLALANRADADGGLQLRAAEPDSDRRLPFRPSLSPRESHAVSGTVSTSSPGSSTGWPTTPSNSHWMAFHSPTRPAAPGSAPSRASTRRFRLPYPLSNRLFFRSSRPPSVEGAFVDTAAQGFYFDDLFYAVANQSAPAICAGRLRDGVRAARHSRAGPDYLQDSRG